MRLRVGTSGFSYPGWRGTLYPDGAKSQDFLRLYADHFDTVELNATFYRMPAAAMLKTMRETTGEDFVFSVKAHRRITHIKRLRECSEVLPPFFEGLEPLGDKLGPILFQLPPNMKFEEERLASFLELLPPRLACFFEFRHPSFANPQVDALLAERGVGLVISDEGRPFAEVLASSSEKRTRRPTYVRLRSEEYSDVELLALANLLVERGGDAYVYVKHEVTGPALAKRLLGLFDSLHVVG